MKKIKILLTVCFMLLLTATPFLVSGCGGNSTSLDLIGTFKTEYFIGEQLDLTGAVVVYTNKQGNETSIEVTDEMVKGFNSSTPGTKQLTIEYGAKVITVDYKINPLIDVKSNQLYYSHPTQFAYPADEHYTYIIFHQDKAYVSMIITTKNADEMYSIFNDEEQWSTYTSQLDNEEFSYVEIQKSTLNSKINYEIKLGDASQTFKTTIESENSFEIKVVKTSDNSLTYIETFNLYIPA